MKGCVHQKARKKKRKAKSKQKEVKEDGNEEKGERFSNLKMTTEVKELYECEARQYANNVNASALNNIGWFTHFGMFGWEKNLQRALCFYKRAYDHGSIMAGNNLAVCLLHGIDIEMEMDKSFEETNTDGTHSSSQIVQMSQMLSTPVDTSTVAQHSSSMGSITEYPSVSSSTLCHIFQDYYQPRIATHPFPHPKSPLYRWLSHLARKRMISFETSLPQQTHLHSSDIIPTDISNQQLLEICNTNMNSHMSMNVIEHEYYFNILSSFKQYLQYKGFEMLVRVYERMVQIYQQNEKELSQMNQRKDLIYCNMAYCYRQGYGTDRNEKKGFNMFMQCQDLPLAKTRIGFCYREGMGVTKDIDQGFKWYSKAAEEGDAMGQCSLGYCYDHGLGVEKNEAKGFEWHMKSANQGYSEGQYNVGWCYMFGKGVPVNEKLGYEWFIKSAIQGDSDAQNIVGWCHELGKGIDKNVQLAFKWYLKSAQHGYASTQYNVARCYEYGIGIRQHLRLSYEWYIRSTSQGYQRSSDQLLHPKFSPSKRLF